MTPFQFHAHREKLMKQRVYSLCPIYTIILFVNANAACFSLCKCVKECQSSWLFHWIRVHVFTETSNILHSTIVVSTMQVDFRPNFLTEQVVVAL